MKDQPSRAQRRADNERLKKNRKNYWGRSYPSNYAKPMTEKQIGMALHTPALCSCMMCGNARRKLKEITIQERRFPQE